MENYQLYSTNNLIIYASDPNPILLWYNSNRLCRFKPNNKLTGFEKVWIFNEDRKNSVRQDFLKILNCWVLSMGGFPPFHAGGQLTSQPLPKCTKFEGLRSRRANFCSALVMIGIKLEKGINLVTPF